MRTILVFTLLLAQQALFGQIRQTGYIELPIDERKGSNYQLIYTGAEGILCLLESEKAEKNNNHSLIFSFYDQELKLKWEQLYLIKNTASLLSTKYDNGFVYFLLQEKDFEYTIMKLNLKDGIIGQIAISDIRDFTATHFEAINGTILMGGVVKNKPAVILKRYDKSNKPIVLPSINQLKAEIIDFVIDEKKEEVVVLLDKKRPMGDKAIYINRYDFEGNVVNNSEIKLPLDYSLITYRPLIIDGELMIFGSYGLKTETVAQGVYNFRIADGKLVQDRFYDFGYLKNFFNYIPSNKREKYISKVQQKLKEGSRKRFSYRLFIHDLYVSDDRIILSGESYDPQSDNTNVNSLSTSMLRSNFGYSSRIPTSTMGYFPSSWAKDAFRNNNTTSEYRYEHAFALGFDKEGNLLWDNSYAFDETKSDLPLELTQVAVSNDTLAFLEYGEESYTFKTSYKSEYQEDNTVIKLPKKFDGDQSKYFGVGGIMRWYGRHFLISGVREFDNLDVTRKRNVFFISKFTFNSSWVDESTEEEEEEVAKDKSKR